MKEKLLVEAFVYNAETKTYEKVAEREIEDDFPTDDELELFAYVYKANRITIKKVYDFTWEKN